MTGLPPLRSHEDLRAALAAALRGDELPGSLLFHGPPGVGKQRLALWLGQLLLCQAPENAGPCGACNACRMSLRLEHPDVLWFFPLSRPRAAGGPERLAEAFEDARAAELDNRRARGRWFHVPGEPVGLFLAQMLTLRRLAASRPVMGRRRLFLVGDAESLVPQESSPEAANALLKLLEEPPDDTTVVLTAADPERILPTLRSRLLPVRVPPLPEDDVARFLLETHPSLDPDRARLVAHLADGSIGRAFAFLPDGDQPGPLESIRRDARNLLDAAAGSDARRLAKALELSPAGARGAFSDSLDFLAIWIRDLAAVANNAEALVVNTDELPFLRNLASRLPAARLAAPLAILRVDQARALAFGNVNPQLTTAWLLRSVNRALVAAE